MKYIIILSLSLLVSCSLKKGSPAGESEAKPVSPYTVKPCYCMKIFKPVCANGISYGNSCEAECHDHKSWQEGPCRKGKK